MPQTAVCNRRSAGQESACPLRFAPSCARYGSPHHVPGMIRSIEFKNFRMLRDTTLPLGRFQSAEPVPKTKRPGNRRKESGHITGNALVVLGLLMVLVGAGMHFGSEELYTAEVRVEFLKGWEGSLLEIRRDLDAESYDPRFIPMTFDLVQSDRVLLPVLHSRTNTVGEELRPDERFIPVWSRRLGLKDGRLLSDQEAVKYLRRHLDFRVGRGSCLVGISATSPIAEEAVSLADLTAASCVQWGRRAQQEIMDRKIAPLKENLEKQARLVEELQSKLEVLRERLGIPENGTNSMSRAAALSEARPSMNQEVEDYLELKRELEEQRRIRDAVLLRILQEEIDSTIPRAALVQIIDPATLIRGPWRRSEPYDDVLMLAGLLVCLSGLWLRSRPKHANGAGSPPGLGVR